MKRLFIITVILFVLVLGIQMAALGESPYEGTTLRLLFNRHVWQEFIEKKIPEFEKATGIKLVVEVFPEDQFRAKRLIEVTSGIADLDVFMIMPGQAGLHYATEGWTYPLDDFINNPEMTPPEWDFNDFFGGLKQGGNFSGKQHSISIQSETSLLAYRKDLLSENGIDVPQTMKELEAAAQKLNLDYDGDGKIDLHGITLRGRRAAATSQFVDFLYTFGGAWKDAEGNWALGKPEAIQAFNFYGKLLREYGPPGATDIHWYESTSYFMTGKAAMIYDANNFNILYEDPEKSEIVGKVGYSVIPAGPTNLRLPHVSHWDLAIHSNSKKKEAAWQFILWATNKENILEAHLAGIPSPRNSSWESEAFLAENAYPDWTEATTISYEIGNPVWNPPVVNVPEARDVVGDIIVSAISGEDIEPLIPSAIQRLVSIEARD
jgi:multiple sugar transport system substrate-binding protein